MAKRDDKIEAKNSVYAAKGEGTCPYPSGSRLEKFWFQYRNHYWNMEARMEEMAQAYGEFRPEKMGVKK